MHSFKNAAAFLPAFRGAILLLGALLAGCGRNDVEVYKVSKETPPADGQAASANGGMMPQGHPDTAGGAPSIGWKLPADWKEQPPGEMRVGSFKVAGKDGKQADVSIIPLPRLSGTDLDNVNRWRGQVGLSPVSAEELPKLAQTLEIAGQPAQLYDQAGTNPASGDPGHILAAIQRRDGTIWFFKMTGDDPLVTEQKPAFIEFLKSIVLTTGPAQAELPPAHPPIGGEAMAAAAAAPSGASAAKPDWQVPAGWQETQGGPFLVAKFLLTGSDNTQGAVNVSMSAGDGGGLLSNVNRWRGQLGLAPLSETELSKLATTLEVAGGKATVVDMSGTDARSGQKARLIGAMVPREGQTWFYKLMGSDSVVEQQKPAFSKFVQSVKYP